MDWVPPPEPMTWVLPNPIKFGSATYPTITLRAPTAGDILMATTIQGASNTQVGLQMIASISVEGVPYEALAQRGTDGLPAHLMEQMTGYFDMFGGAPMPGPLEAWIASRVAAAKAEAKAEAEAKAQAAEPSPV